MASEAIEAHKIEIVYSDKIDSIKCLPSIVEKALEMEKEQIINAYLFGERAYNFNLQDAQYYYNETYGE